MTQIVHPFTGCCGAIAMWLGEYTGHDKDLLKVDLEKALVTWMTKKSVAEIILAEYEVTKLFHLKG